MDQNVALAKLIIYKSNPIEKGVKLINQLWCEDWQRDFDVLVLHDLQDLQALGSLTTPVQAQTVVHGPCVRPMPLLRNQALQSASTLPLCIHAICINYSLTTLWHLPDYVPNLCICNWFLGFNNSCPQSFIILVDCRVLLLNGNASGTPPWQHPPSPTPPWQNTPQ